MNDPASAAAATGAASAISAGAAGAGAAALSALGIEPAALFWALLGASIGLSFAAATGRVRTVIVFAAVVLICSLFGAWLAQRYFAGETLSRNMLACLCAVFFHPILGAAVTRLPAALDGLMRRFGIGGNAS
jgi:pimeloyl-ACP methyl ester carboxylesterase